MSGQTIPARLEAAALRTLVEKLAKEDCGDCISTPCNYCAHQAKFALKVARQVADRVAKAQADEIQTLRDELASSKMAYREQGQELRHHIQQIEKLQQALQAQAHRPRN